MFLNLFFWKVGATSSGLSGSGSVSLIVLDSVPEKQLLLFQTILHICQSLSIHNQIRAPKIVLKCSKMFKLFTIFGLLDRKVVGHSFFGLLAIPKFFVRIRHPTRNFYYKIATPQFSKLGKARMIFSYILNYILTSITKIRKNRKFYLVLIQRKHTIRKSKCPCLVTRQV